jgi:hypothetical protein
MNNPKVLVALFHGLYEPWLSILNQGQAKTWLDLDRPSEIQVVHFHSTKLGALGWKFDRLHEFLRWKNKWFAYVLQIFDRLVGFPLMFYVPSYSRSEKLDTTDLAVHIHFPDSYQFMRWKDLSVLKYFVTETNADFIFMSTTSSYLLPHKLLEVIQAFPMNKVYAGVDPYNGANFAAGNNRLISRDVANLILKHRIRFDPGVIEDRAMGEMLTRMKIEFKPLPSLHVTSEDELDGTPNSKLMSHFHIRVKSGAFHKRNDVSLMRAVHRRVLGEIS